VQPSDAIFVIWKRRAHRQCTVDSRGNRERQPQDQHVNLPTAIDEIACVIVANSVDREAVLVAASTH